VAKQKRGDPIPRAGNPQVQDIPDEYQGYLEAVTQNPRYSTTVTPGATFKLVEIDPLLAFQVHITPERTGQIVPVGFNPGLENLLRICLPHMPLTLDQIPHDIGGDSPTSFIIESPNVNLRVIATGASANDDKEGLKLVGIAIGESSPLVQVVRFNGRCYLRNGYHRALAIRRAGQTHIPCLFLEATAFLGVVERPTEFLFRQKLLESVHPPTLGHYAQGRALSVTLRDVKRFIRVTWIEDVVPV
jgi:hypothetical protein